MVTETSSSQGSRYLIYRLLKQQIRVIDPRRKKIEGRVVKVYRNIMEGRVELKVDGEEVHFAEPATIRQEGKEVIFCYGKSGLEDEGDEALWEEVRSGSCSGESLGEVLRRTAPAVRHETRFCLV